MTTRPPYRSAAVVSLVVLAGYLVTLAPTVTFWDAGEFITAARTLGIPHPPGTPLFVLLSSVWGRLIPLGAFAWRLNLLSATCSALAAGCWFLVVHDIVSRMHADVDTRSRSALAMLSGVAAGMLVGFSYSIWQSATETEVYATTTLSTALVAWLATRWRALRTDVASARLLLMALYLGALAVGTHLMGLLVGPALIVMAVVLARTEPLADSAAQRGEWARIGVVAAAWVLLVAIGLAQGFLTAAGLALLLVAAGRAARNRQTSFAAIACVVVVIGASTFGFLYLRAHQQPWLNSGNPGTWHDLLDVIRRSQYPPRTPLDDPTVFHGPDNPGRTLTLLGYQLANYVQHFDWQWASSFGELSRPSIPRLGVTLLMITLGIRGAFAQRRTDRPSFVLIGVLFFVAGPLLVLYLNFKPGPSIGWDRWLTIGQHEVRDRDYFFVGSFAAWGIWVAIGLADVVRRWAPRVPGPLRAASIGVFAVALIPPALNFRAATRRQTVEATLARDFAHALLASVPSDAILFTYGDNDSFPLWFAQQVEGFRPDVTVVCLSLAQTGWYIRQLAPLYDLPAEQVVRAPFRAARDIVMDLGPHGVATIHAGAVVFPVDIVVFDLLRKNAGHRPVAWSISAVDQLYGLDRHLVQTGLALLMPVGVVDSSALVAGDAAAPGGTALDLVATRALVDHWSFGTLETLGPVGLDANIRAVVGTIAAPMTQTGIALVMRGDTAAGLAMLRRAARLADDSAAKAVLARLANPPAPSP